jgi:NAD(P)-dependent dehydrogenase (short-subunit alcohol dehydrogenase family)
MSDDAAGRAGVVVVTGGAGGMGVACARTLSDLGQLLLTDLDAQALDRAIAALRSDGIEATTFTCDVTEPADVAALAKHTQSLGPLRALVHTAGLSPMMGDGRKVLSVDLVGTARLLEAFAPMVQAGTAVICISSIAGYVNLTPELERLLDDPLSATFLDDVEASLDAPLDGIWAYVLAKHGVMAASEIWAKELGARGGRIVAVAPGLIDTEMGRFELSQQPIMRDMADATPVQRDPDSTLPGRPEDIAATVAFLCSDDASFISGCDIRVDGGLTGASRRPTPKA